MSESTLPPHDKDAEYGLIGSLVIDPDAIFMVSDVLNADDFYIKRCGTAYSAVLSLISQNEAVDPITIAHEMKKIGDDETAVDWLVGLMGETPSSLHVERYASIVVEMSQRRKMIQTGGKIAQLGYAIDGDIHIQEQEAQSVMLQMVSSRNGDTSHPSKYVMEYMEDMDRLRTAREVRGLKTPWHQLNSLLVSIKNYTYYLAGRPGMGKSAAAVKLGWFWAHTLGKKGAFFSQEMGKAQLIDRIITIETGIEIAKLEDPRLQSEAEQRAVNQVLGYISQSGLFIEDAGGLTPSQIRTKAMKIKMQHGLDFVIVDHLHLMRPDRHLGSDYANYTEIAKSLAEFPKREILDCPVIVLAQLNRDLDKRQEKRPKLADFRDTGAIEENAYAAIFIHRDEYYNNEMTLHPGRAEFIVAKHRQGKTGTAFLYWHGARTSFENLKETSIL